MSPVYKFSAPRKFTAGPTIYTSMLAGNTKYDNWADTAAAGDAGFITGYGTGNEWVSCFNHSVDGTWFNFGDLTATGMSGSGFNHNGGGANATRWLMMGGYGSGAPQNPIWYATVATKSAGSSFGTLATARFAGAQMGNSTIAMAYAGYLTSDIQTVNYATTGNATVFGSARQPHYNNGSSNSTTRAVSYGGQYGSQETTIDYVEFATTGNYNAFGTITSSNNHNGGGSSTRGLDIASTVSTTQLTSYITIASTGNATNYGSLTVARWFVATSSKASTYMVVFCGYTFASNGASTTTTADKFLISSTSNAIAWGTLTTGFASGVGNCAGGQNSNCHGGL
jgi:hypothetical protein